MGQLDRSHPSLRELVSRNSEVLEAIARVDELVPLFDTFFSGLPLSAWIKQRVTPVHFEIVAANKAYTKNLGIPYSDVVGKTEYELWGANSQVFEVGDAHIVRHARPYVHLGTFKYGRRKATQLILKWPAIRNGVVVAICGLGLPLSFELPGVGRITAHVDMVRNDSSHHN